MIRVAFFIALLVYLLYLLVSVLSFAMFEHSDFVKFFTSHYPYAYRIDEYGEKYFTPDHFQFVADYVVAFALPLVVLMFLLLWRRRTVGNWIDGLARDIVQVKEVIVSAIVDLGRGERLFLLVCFLSLATLKTYFFFELPFYVDDAFNFAYFADEGVFHSSVFANNHTLTNIISAIWWKTGLTPEWSFRLTSVLSSLAIHVLIYSVTTHYFNFKTGIVALMFSGVTFWGNVYSVEGVAYMLMSLWVVMASISVFFMLENSDRGNALFIVSSVLGFYTTQLFIIPFVALVIFWFLAMNYKGTTIVIVMLIVAVASILLYFPMYLWSGFDATFHSGMARYDLVRMVPAFFEGFSVITEVNSKSYLVIMGLIAATVFYIKGTDPRLKCLLGLNVSIVCSILIFSLIIGIYPPSRSLVFANIVFFASAAIVISDLIFRRLSNKLATVALGILFFTKIAGSVYLLKFGWQHMPLGLQDKRSYEQLRDLSEELLSHKPNVIYSDVRDTHLNFYLAFVAIRNNQRIKFLYDSTDLSEADMIILDDRNIVIDEQYKVLTEGEFARVLIRK